MNRVNTLVIDSNKLFREGIKKLFEGSPFQVISESNTLKDSVSSVLGPLDTSTNLVIFDIATNEVDGQALSQLRSLLPSAKFVVLTSVLNARFLSLACNHGVHGYLMKDISMEALVQSLKLIMMGEKIFPAHLATIMTGEGANDNSSQILLPKKGLSPREKQILACLVKGNSNKVIANALNITEATVKVHLKSLLRKINVTNRTQAAIWGLNNGIVQEENPSSMVG